MALSDLRLAKLGLAIGFVVVTASHCRSSATAEGRMETSAGTLLQSQVHTRGSVILVALDGVRWQDVFSGVDRGLARRHHVPIEEQLDGAHLLPNLRRLMTVDGAALGGPSRGATMRASGPNFVSLPGYVELLSGRSDSGCSDNACARVRVSTLADEAEQASGEEPRGEPAAFASWSDIDRAVTTVRGRVAVSAGRYGGSRRERFDRDAAVAASLKLGERARPEPGEGDFRPDAHTGNAALAYLRAHRPRFLFIGLGETDEYGHKDDYRGYLSALRRADAIIGRIAKTVFERNARGDATTLFITTDHGRSSGFSSHGRAYPESARVWLIAAGAGIEARGRIASPQTRHLADVAPTIRHLIGLPQVGQPGSGQVLTELLSSRVDGFARAQIGPRRSNSEPIDGWSRK
jgi:hypothetical protein